MIKKQPLLLLSLSLILSGNASAYNSRPVDEQCKKPRFQKFSLPTYKLPERLEIAPASVFSFILSNKVALETLKLTIKNQKLPYKIENKQSFYRITSQIPAKYTDMFLRINAIVTAKLECKGKDGWLVKVSPEKEGVNEDKPVPLPPVDAKKETTQ